MRAQIGRLTAMGILAAMLPWLNGCGGCKQQKADTTASPPPEIRLPAGARAICGDDLLAVHFLPGGRTGLVAGCANTLLRTVDGGATWAVLVLVLVLGARSLRTNTRALITRRLATVPSHPAPSVTKQRPVGCSIVTPASFFRVSAAGALFQVRLGIAVVFQQWPK